MNMCIRVLKYNKEKDVAGGSWVSHGPKSRRTPGNGRALILKRHLWYGQDSVNLSRICAWPPSGPPYAAYFSSNFVRIGRIWPKIAADEALQKCRKRGVVETTLKIIATIDRQLLVNLVP